MSRKQKRTKTKSSVIDIAITTAGRFDMLEKCLDALYQEAQTIPLSIYISDIDSPQEDRNQNENLFQYNEDKDPAHNVINYRSKRFTENVGFPMGANDAMKMGRSPLVMCLNDDVELQPGTIQEIVNTFNDETVGIAGIRLLFPENSSRSYAPAGKIQHVGLALGIHGNPVHPLVGWSPDNPKTQRSRDVWSVTGACLTIRRNLFNKTGGFDLVYGRGTWEDADLCMKVRQLGQRIYMNSKAWGYHYTGASAEKRKDGGFPLQQNMQIFQSRWAKTGMIVYDEFTYY